MAPSVSQLSRVLPGNVAVAQACQTSCSLVTASAGCPPTQHAGSYTLCAPHSPVHSVVQDDGRPGRHAWAPPPPQVPLAFPRAVHSRPVHRRPLGGLHVQRVPQPPPQALPQPLGGHQACPAKCAINSVEAAWGCEHCMLAAAATAAEPGWNMANPCSALLGQMRVSGLRACRHCHTALLCPWLQGYPKQAKHAPACFACPSALAAGTIARTTHA